MLALAETVQKYGNANQYQPDGKRPVPCARGCQPPIYDHRRKQKDGKNEYQYESMGVHSQNVLTDSKKVVRCYWG